MAWLTGLFTDPNTATAAYGLVILLLILAMVFAFSRMRHARRGMFVAGGRKQRLAVVDATAVDNRRRLVLVRRDGVEHLLLIGGHNDLVIEGGIAGETDEPRVKAEPANKPAPAIVAEPPQKKAESPPVQAPKPAPIPQPAPKTAPEPQPVAEPAPVMKPIDPVPPVQPAAPSQPMANRPSPVLTVAEVPPSSSDDEDATRTIEAEMERLLGGIVDTKDSKA